MKLSIVIPILNERENIPGLYQELCTVMRQEGYSYQLIFVDDGSSDGSYQTLSDLHAQDPHLVVIRFRRNFGQTAALSAGFKHSTGDIIITLDGDRQNDPKDIPKLLAKMEEGYDLVSGWRVDRQDTLARRLPSLLANRLISKITGLYLHDYGCTLKAYKREILSDLNMYGEMHRFIPALLSWMGINVAEIPVNHRPRTKGVSKYGLNRTFTVILDLINVKFLLSYSTRPIQIFGSIGLFSLLLGLVSGLMVLYLKLVHSFNMTGNPLLYLTVLLVFIGFQFITMGLLGEINIRTYHEIQSKPIFVIKELLEETE